MEFNLTLDHLAGALVLSLFLVNILKGMLLIRSIIWVFLWQILTPTNDLWYLDLMSCFALFFILEMMNIYVNYTQQKQNNL